eukprot:scaffold23436_cov68-Phaeocystis_antarctica.AAC.4
MELRLYGWKRMVLSVGILFSLDIYTCAHRGAHGGPVGGWRLYGYAGDWSVRRRVGARDRW